MFTGAFIYSDIKTFFSKLIYAIYSKSSICFFAVRGKALRLYKTPSLHLNISHPNLFHLPFTVLY